jgi:hypothetical protein
LSSLANLVNENSKLSIYVSAVHLCIKVLGSVLAEVLAASSVNQTMLLNSSTSSPLTCFDQDESFACTDFASMTSLNLGVTLLN